MTVYMISGYDTITGKQDIIDYIPAEDAETACEEYVRLNPSCEVNEILDEFEEVLEMEKKTIRIMVKDDTKIVSSLTISLIRSFILLTSFSNCACSGVRTGAFRADFLLDRRFLLPTV